MTDEAGPSNGSDDQTDRPEPATRHRSRRGESTGLSGAPAWMTGEVPRVEGSPEAGRRRARSGDPTGRGGKPAQDTHSDAAPNIVRHVDRPAPIGVGGEDAAAVAGAAGDGEESAALGEATSAQRVPAWHSDLDDAERAAKRSAQADTDPERMPGRGNRRRWALIAASLLAVVILAVGGYLVADRLGLLISKKDFADTAGTSDVLVRIPDNSTLTNFGEILTGAGVVGSVHAFVTAADGKPLSGGIYQMRTGIPAATAVQMMSDSTHRVGRLVVPEGVQLEAKRGVDSKTIHGVFDRIAEATDTTLNGKKIGVTVGQLEAAATTASPDELGVPSWARAAVDKLPGDYRRIEGLIAPGTWEAINPQASAAEILNRLIGDSARRYEAWGLLTGNRSGLSPYEVLVAASVAEREVRDADDLPKVARVILNRLAKKQRLEMDSTTNYTAAETNIDVHGENYKADTRWNTYRVLGLPPTPIATVGERALKAMLDPPPGNWLYFITVDKQGTTKFSDTFEEHLRNRKTACDNKFLKTGC